MAELHPIAAERWKEDRELAIQCSAAVALFRKVTGAPSGAPGVVDMYLLTTPAARDAFVTSVA